MVRVTWHEAMSFCDWLSERTGHRFTLPSEHQWEWAARAGSTTPLWFGGLEADFSKHANLADAVYQSRDTFGWGLPSGAIPAWRPAAAGVNDGHRVSAPAGTFQPNPFGLRDMAGNVAEWTRSRWNHGPPGPVRRHVVRGGSWRAAPRHAQSTSRLAYRPAQSVVDVGFRVVSAE